MKYIEILINNYPSISEIKTTIESATQLLIDTFRIGNKVLVCGNGGSAADSEHIAGELMKGFLKSRALSDEDKQKFGEISGKLQYGLPCIPLTSFSALNTAVINDNSADMIFAQSVMALGCENDTLIALSTSGNSNNVVNAAKVATAKGLNIISITGENESALSEISDITIRIPEKETYRIQELTLPVYHAICTEIEDFFFKK